MFFGQDNTGIQVQPQILLVDDEPRLLESLKQLISGAGYETLTAATGAAAIALLERKVFTLVLLDLGLPDTSGHHVMEYIRAHSPDTSVIVVSGDASINSAIMALRNGAYDFIRKPYAPEELLNTVRNALDKSRLLHDNKQIRLKLEQSEYWHRYLVNNSPDIIYTLDPEGRFTFVNERLKSMLGFKHEELVGKHYTHIIHDEDIHVVPNVFNERRTGDRASRNSEIRLKHKERDAEGQSVENYVVTVELSSIGIYEIRNGQASSFVGTYGVAKDIGERKRAEATINYQAYHDLLTGLPNRALFNDRLTQAIVQAKRNSQYLAVMFLDLDRFKLVNDTLGHMTGDTLLQLVASRLRHCLREGDTLARFGGDEFVLLLPRVSAPGDAETIAQKIIQIFEPGFNVESHELYVSASVGVALFPNNGDTVSTLVKCADIAMYQAKDKGRNNYQFYCETNTLFPSQLSLENEMHKAIERNELELFYQPQVSILTGEIVGVEALIRWHHPIRGLLMPMDFISLAEEIGLINPIGDWVIRVASQQAKKWKEELLKPLFIAINLSTRQIEQPYFVERFNEVLDAAGIAGNMLEIEITESALMKDAENTISKLKKLSQRGVRISVDDFGTGYSSLSYLNKLPIHTLKIDQSFVHDLALDPSAASIVTAIVAMAKSLKLNLVAEGVETETQLEFLRQIGCDQYQGFLFSGAIDAASVSCLLAAKRPATI
jgi:diguanylate cyclase (GGDEF)-like protein/PAS domain S-box-containing protein